MRSWRALFGLMACLPLLVSCSGAAGSYQAVQYQTAYGGYTVTLKTRGLGVVHAHGMTTMTLGAEDVTAFYEGDLPRFNSAKGIWVDLPDQKPLHVSRRSHGIALGMAPAFAGLNVGAQFTEFTCLDARGDVELRVRSPGRQGPPEFFIRQHSRNSPKHTTPQLP